MFVFRILIALSLVVCASNTFANEPFLVKKTELEDKKAILATVQSADQTIARTRIGGVVTELLIDEGDFVEQGQLLARVVDDKLALQLETTQARIASLQAEKKLAQIALNRAQKLRKTGAGSQAKLDEKRTNLDIVVKNLKAMESEKQLVLQRQREGDVLSPANGRILSVKTIKGAVVLSGEKIADIAQENYILRIEVPERHARFMRNGDKIDLDKTGKIQGEIILVYPEIKQGRLTADVKAPNIGDYFIGERIPAYITTGTRVGFLVPQEFIYQKFGLYFALLENQREIVIQPGAKRGAKLEILSGLREGDILISPKSMKDK